MVVTSAGEASVGCRIVSQTWAAAGSEAQAVLAISLTPAGKGFAIVTAKLRETWAPAARAESASEQVDPVADPGVQVHPGELEAAEKVVFAGTVSRREGAAASRLPVFRRVNVHVRVEPGVAVPEDRVFDRERLGDPPKGVVVVEQLLAVGSPAVDVELQAVLVTEAAAAGRVESIRSPKVTV